MSGAVHGGTALLFFGGTEKLMRADIVLKQKFRVSLSERKNRRKI
jgi:hypothetical protein